MTTTPSWSFGNTIDLHILQVREEQIDAAGVLARAGMQHNDLAAARRDQFRDEQDPDDAAARMRA
ncbi:hypothetical protein ACH35V_32490 [Actinomadura sp. 1N219]|uniref:hypothetical protein n=1 Tax=Actinomadura sp. 1N219 TaxID=3375152 RepID=UPI0037B54024